MKEIIATEIKEGQGLGNRLFVYVSTRAIARKKGWDFRILNADILERGIRDSKGIPFMELDYGEKQIPTHWLCTYREKGKRLFVGNSKHDMEYGVDISSADKDVFAVSDGMIIDGILQDPMYFSEYKEEIKEWLSVRPEYDSYEYTRDNLCVINIRGGEYSGSPELFLRRKYWLDAMANMRKIRDDMEFMVITDSVEEAKRILPEVKAFHFEVWKDYVTIKNARYLILSNSSFAFFPAYTSTEAKMIIAPKYWARHNVSDGYWSTEQNIYDEFIYQDRHGNLCSADECRKELEEYKKNSKEYISCQKKATGLKRQRDNLRAKRIYLIYWAGRAIRSFCRRIKRTN